MDNNESKMAWILYGAMFSAMVFYGVVGFLIRGSAAPAPNPLLPMLTAIFLAAAGMETVLLLAWASQMAGKMLYVGYCVIRWVLAEAIGIYGFVLFLLGAEQVFFVTFLGWSLALMLLCMPTEADREKFDLLKRGG